MRLRIPVRPLGVPPDGDVRRCGNAELCATPTSCVYKLQRYAPCLTPGHNPGPRWAKHIARCCRAPGRGPRGGGQGVGNPTPFALVEWAREHCVARLRSRSSREGQRYQACERGSCNGCISGSHRRSWGVRRGLVGRNRRVCVDRRQRRAHAFHDLTEVERFADELDRIGRTGESLQDPLVGRGNDKAVWSGRR